MICFLLFLRPCVDFFCACIQGKHGDSDDDRAVSCDRCVRGRTVFWQESDYDDAFSDEEEKHMK